MKNTLELIYQCVFKTEHFITEIKNEAVLDFFHGEKKQFFSVKY